MQSSANRRTVDDYVVQEVIIKIGGTRVTQVYCLEELLTGQVV